MRFSLKILLFFLLFFDVGCAPKSKILEQMIHAGKYEKAVTKGEKWIEDWDREERNSNEGKSVRYLVAKAEFKAAVQKESYIALGAFRRKYRGPKLFAKLVRDAFDEESQFYYRQVTITHGRPADFQMFRRLYPNAPDTRNSKIQEVKAAFQVAKKRDQISSYNQFRNKYKYWPGASELLQKARKREGDLWYKKRVLVRESIQAHRDFRKTYPRSSYIQASRSRELHLALKEVNRQMKVSLFRKFRRIYGGWSEAKEAVKDIYTKEAELALRNAIVTNTTQAFDNYRKNYPQQEWIDKADHAELKLAFVPIQAALQRGRYPQPYQIKHFISRFAEHRYIQQFIEKHREPLWKMLKKNPNVWGFRLFRAFYPKDKRNRKALKEEKNLQWKQATTQTNRYLYLDFFQWYPDDSRALQAEERYYRLKRLQEMGSRWPRTTIQSQRTLPSGEIELVVDVRDCLQERVSGLTKDVFSVYSGHEQQRITRFQGMEDERPIDIIFNLDMSGSMKTERKAVNEAIMHFVETFNFRNRRLRLGLIGFSEEIKPKHHLNRSVKSFRKWMSKLPGNAGGVGEDAVNALVQSAKMWPRGKAERVIVLITDEDLQVNRGGKKALGIGENKQCKQMEKTNKCIQKCARTRDPYNCYPKCVRLLNSNYRRSYDHCLKTLRKRKVRNPKRHCVRNVNWRGIQSALRRCTEPVVRSNSPVMQALQKRLNKSMIRPYFLVPRGVSHGFQVLARATQGVIKYVPQNSRYSKPYIKALMEIADQLSRQYILRFRPKNKYTSQLYHRVLVEKKHIWKPIGQVPPGELVAMSQGLMSSAACPDFIAVTRDQGIFTLNSCKEKWEKLGSFQEHPLSAIEIGRFFVILTKEENLYTIDRKSKVISKVQLPNTRIKQIAKDGSQLLFLEAKKDKNFALSLLDVEKGKATSITHPKITSERSIPLLYLSSMKKGSLLCIQPNSKTRWCRQKNKWNRLSSTGIPTKALFGYGQVHTPPERQDVLLFAASSGTVYRSIDGGKKWNTSLRSSGSRPSIAFVPGKKKAVTCVSTSESVHCSETAGLLWFGAGHRFDNHGTSILATVNNELYVLQPNGLHRLDQVSNRELPSSSVYFDTGAEKPLASLRPFLKDIAKAMKANKALDLVIEGHADKRGSAKHNEKLAAQRAKNVAAIIRRQGVDSKRIQTMSYGERRPLRKDSSKESLARNRRVELILTRRASAKGLTVDPCEGK